MTRDVRLALAALALAGTSCSAASTATVAHVSGTYVLSVVDGANGCMYAGLTQGHAQLGVQLVVAQDAVVPQNMTVTLGGDPGKVLQAAVGTAQMTGTLGGQQATLVPGALDGGVPSGSIKGCTFTTNASLTLNFTSDTVQGTLLYTITPTNTVASCDAISSCQSVEAIAGVQTPSDT